MKFIPFYKTLVYFFSYFGNILKKQSQYNGMPYYYQTFNLFKASYYFRNTVRTQKDDEVYIIKCMKVYENYQVI